MSTTTTNTTVPPRPTILVLGAGIIGLTSAIEILQSPLHPQVHILATHLPSDPVDPEYASVCAGAHHLSFAADGDERQARWDGRTFERMQSELEEEGGESGLMSLIQNEYYEGEERHLKFLESYPEFKIHPPSETPTFASHSVSFRSLTMTPQTYLARLLARFLTLGGKVWRQNVISLASLPHLCSTLPIGPEFQAVVVCVGLGARGLEGVRDGEVFPTTGQIVTIDAPWIRTGFTWQQGSMRGVAVGMGERTKDGEEEERGENGEGGLRTYVIPRSNGEVVLGGTREIGNWSKEIIPSTTEHILTRVLTMNPSILSQHPTTPLPGTAPLPERLELLRSLVTSQVVGFRPSRSSGPRVERGPDLSSNQEVDVSDQADDGSTRTDTPAGKTSEAKVKVIYNYGHGGAGWQACWGAAEDTRDLVLAALSGWTGGRG